MFLRVKSAYTEGLRQNSISSPPRVCQDNGVSNFSGMGQNYCNYLTQQFQQVETDCRFRAPTLLHPYESSSSLFLGQQLSGGTAGRQPSVLLTVEGGTGENAETEESWTDPSHQPALCHTFHGMLRQVQNHTSSPALLSGCLKLSRQRFSVPLLVSILTCQQSPNLECSQKGFVLLYICTGYLLFSSKLIKI